MSDPEANKRCSSLIWRRSQALKTFFGETQGSGKKKGARNCGYARKGKSACAVFHVFSRVEECSDVRFTELCKLLFFTLVAGFYTLLLSFIAA